MVNRDMAHRFPERSAKIGEPVLNVENWSVYHPIHPERQVIKNVDFGVKRGEVVGIAGLMGAGRTEFAMTAWVRLRLHPHSLPHRSTHKLPKRPRACLTILRP